MDLVLDGYIKPNGSWAWKDRAEFDRAIDEGLLPESLPHTLANEADAVLRDHAAGVGAFEPRWCDFRPPSTWQMARLPDEFFPGASQWAGALA